MAAEAIFGGMHKSVVRPHKWLPVSGASLRLEEVAG